MPTRAVASSPPRAGRPKGRFTQHRRIDALRELLESHTSGLTLEAMARDLRMTPRSVRRYLSELSRHTEIESVPLKPGGAHVWRIRPSERGRAVMLRRTQVFGLLATRPLFEALRGSALYDEMDLVHRQLLQLGQRPARAGGRTEVPADARLHERFFFAAHAARSYGTKGEEVDAVFDAVAQSRVLSFRYRPPGSGTARAERITMEPYALVAHGGVLHFVGRDRDQNVVRAFRVDALVEVRTHEGEAFLVPEDFDVRAFVDGDFGVGTGSPRARVLVEFDASVADDVRTRRFHPTQRVAVAPDGRVRLTFTAEHLDAVAAWVLSYGPSAQVLDPPELAAAVASKLRATLARYGG